MDRTVYIHTHTHTHTFSLPTRIAHFYTIVVTSCTVTVIEHIAHV